MRRLVCFLIAATLPTVSASAEFRTGHEIKAGLEGWVSDQSIETVRDAIAFGYVIGVHDALAGTAVCIGEGVTQRQVVDVVLEFMRRNPTVLDASADRVIAVALEEVWSCPKT